MEAEHWHGSWGRLVTEEQVIAFRREVAGKIVHDLGAGSMSLSRYAAAYGAEAVHAVDRRLDMTHGFIPRVAQHHVDFEQWASLVRASDFDVELAVVSWPVNHRNDARHLVRILERANRVVYLGKNTDGTTCGTPVLWEHLRKRVVNEYLPDRLNTMIVYGGLGDLERPLRGEERAGLSAKIGEVVLSYDEVER